MKTHYYLLTFLITIANIESHAQEDFSLSSLDQNIKLENTLILHLDNFFRELTNGEFSNTELLIDDDPLSLSVFNEIAYLELVAADSTKSINREIINYYPVGMNRYVIQVATYVPDHRQTNNLFLIWTFVAHKTKDTYLFSTPLNYYTSQWKTEQISSVTYFYKQDLNLPRAELFAYKNKMYSNKFKQKEANLKFYMTGDYQEILHLIGIDYDNTSAGKYKDGWGVIADQYIFAIMNNEDFSHDLFHFYSGQVHERESRNWVSEEGLAYSWGNAYYTKENSGEIAGQAELIKVLKEYLAKHPETELYSLFNNHFWTDTSGIFNHLSTDYKVGRLLSSLICDAIEEQTGMSGINQLISCGSLPDRFTSFLETTNKLIGLNAENFNVRVDHMLRNYSK